MFLMVDATSRKTVFTSFRDFKKKQTRQKNSLSTTQFALGLGVQAHRDLVDDESSHEAVALPYHASGNDHEYLFSVIQKHFL